MPALNSKAQRRQHCMDESCVGPEEEPHFNSVSAPIIHQRSVSSHLPGNRTESEYSSQLPQPHQQLLVSSYQPNTFMETSTENQLDSYLFPQQRSQYLVSLSPLPASYRGRQCSFPQISQQQPSYLVACLPYAPSLSRQLSPEYLSQQRSSPVSSWSTIPEGARRLTSPAPSNPSTQTRSHHLSSPIHDPNFSPSYTSEFSQCNDGTSSTMYVYTRPRANSEMSLGDDFGRNHDDSSTWVSEPHSLAYQTTTEHDSNPRVSVQSQADYGNIISSPSTDSSVLEGGCGQGYAIHNDLTANGLGAGGNPDDIISSHRVINHQTRLLSRFYDKYLQFMQAANEIPLQLHNVPLHWPARCPYGGCGLAKKEEELDEFQKWFHHIKTVHLKKYRCELCIRLVFGTNSDLKRHTNSVHDKLMLCFCNMIECRKRTHKWARVDKLNDHIKKWHKHPCEVVGCNRGEGFGFKTSKLLDEHLTAMHRAD